LIDLILNITLKIKLFNEFGLNFLVVYIDPNK